MRLVALTRVCIAAQNEQDFKLYKSLKNKVEDMALEFLDLNLAPIERRLVERCLELA